MHTQSSACFTALLLAAVAAFGASSARAQRPTLITAVPYTITTPGKYQLQADLVYNGNPKIENDAIITINASNVVLDFNGHYLSGPSGTPGTTLRGIHAMERGNLVIRNGTIAFCNVGIQLSGNGGAGSLNINQRVENMLVTYCYSAGVLLNTARNSDVLNSRVSFIGGTLYNASAYGIACDAAGCTLSNNVITDVTAYSTGSSFGITGSASTFEIGNRVSSCDYGIYGGKYQRNLTSNCKTPFANGVDASLNQ